MWTFDTELVPFGENRLTLCRGVMMHHKNDESAIVQGIRVQAA